MTALTVVTFILVWVGLLKYFLGVLFAVLLIFCCED